jgi:hypothetical protein
MSSALSDHCVADLTETALELALRHGVNRPSVDLEIALWHSLQSAAAENKRPVTSGTDGLRPDRKSTLARLTEAAYQTVLHSGLNGSFIDLEIGLWNAFRKDCPAAA